MCLNSYTVTNRSGRVLRRWRSWWPATGLEAKAVAKLLLTLTGGAGAGKTTLAAALVEASPVGSVRVLHGDDYYVDGPECGVWVPDEEGVLRLDVFVDLPADLRLARKIQRKCLGEGFPLDVLLRNYLSSRRSAHERHVEPERAVCDLVVEADVPAGVLASRVWAAVGRDPFPLHEADPVSEPASLWI